MTNELGPLPASTQAISINLLDEQQVDAEQHMNNLNGEHSGRIFEAGFDVKARGIDKPSEDVAYIYEDKQGQTFIGVFDGMGGHEAGDMAANAARDVLHSRATLNKRMGNPNGLANDYFEDVVDEISARISNSHGEADGAGTTGLMAVLVENADGTKSLHGAAVGDSLGYVVRSNGDVEQLNREESLRQELLDAGKDAETADKQGNVITNAISPGSFNGVHERFETVVMDGDVIVFTSDGITGDKSTQRLRGGKTNEEVISKVALDTSLTAKQKAQKLIELSTKSDDKTAVVLEIKSKNSHYEDLDVVSVETKKEKNGSRIAGLFAKRRTNKEVKIQKQRAEELAGFIPDVDEVTSAGSMMIEHGSDEEDRRLRIKSANERLATPLIELGDRSLTEIWTMGQTMVGVVDTLNPDGSYKDTEVLLFPFGKTAGENQSTVELRADDLKDGLPPQIKINRTSLAIAAGEKGAEDPEISKDHLTVSVNHDGRLMMTGNSLNGTFIIDGFTRQNGELTDLLDYIKTVDQGVLYPVSDPTKKTTVVRP